MPCSDLGVGGVLLQEDQQPVEHPIAYFLPKFNKSQQNYCTSEKETLALILALQYFEFYLSAAQYPILVQYILIITLSRSLTESEKRINSYSDGV